MRYYYDLHLYKNSPVEESSPAYFDDLTHALDNFNANEGEHLIIGDIAPVTMNLDIDLRLPLAGNSANTPDKYSYAIISTRNALDVESLYFFFVRQIRRRANKCLEISLHMDVVNTLLKSSDLSDWLTAKTMLTREHESRWAIFNVTTNDEGTKTVDVLAKADKVGEGLGDLPLIQTTSTPMYDRSFETAKEKEASWQSLYGKDGTTPVICFNPAGTTIKVKDAASDSYQDVGNAQLSYDSTSQSITKVIMLPYLPFFDVSKDSEGYRFRYSFNRTIHDVNITIGKPTVVNTVSIPSIGADIWDNSGRRIINSVEIGKFQTITAESVLAKSPRKLVDSKLFHSDFYSLRFAYDTFATSFFYENFEFKSFKTGLDIEFIGNSSPISSFAFMITPSLSSNMPYLPVMNYESTSDWDTILFISRNNERTLYTDAYLNYLRTGYNFDTTGMVWKDTAAILGAGTAVIGATIAGGVLAPVAAAGAVIGAISSIASSANSQIKKEASLRAQAISAKGSESYVPFVASRENKLYKIEYELPCPFKNMVDDLFYYYGYKRGYQAVPNANSRYWFNFVQCTPKYKSDFRRTWSYLLDELTKKFEYGITFFHRHEDVTGDGITYGYDLEQSRENWENDIIINS